MKKPRVLMLGWEFPPIISGGLGIACYGIAKSVSQKADLTLILPRTDENFNMPGVELIGLGNIELEDIFEKTELREFQETVKEKNLEVSIYPYPREQNRWLIREKKISEQEKIKTRDIHHIHNRFRDADLYGENVVDKVGYYAEIIVRIAKKLEFDLIHAHDWMTFPAGIRLKEESGKPLVLHIHSLNFDRVGPVNAGWIYELEKNSMLKADLIIPVSNYTSSVIKEHYGVSGNKVYPVHNGIDAIKVTRTRKNFPDKLVLFMGRITLQKGPEYFLETAQKVIRKYDKVRFAIAGTGDKLKKMIEEGAYREISRKLHFTGFLDRQKVHKLLSMSDVFCMPSLSEPFGLTALEAVQFGVPVVITSRSGAAEVLSGALTADFWDTDLMAGHIISLLEDQDLYNAKVYLGYRDIKKLTWEASAEKILRGYQKII